MTIKILLLMLLMASILASAYLAERSAAAKQPQG